MSHKHFTIEERENILEFLTLKKSIDGKYNPDKAQKLYKKRKIMNIKVYILIKKE